VLDPIKVVITNFPEGQTEELEAVNHPGDPGAGTRKIPFGRTLFIDRDDFMEVPPPKYFRLRRVAKCASSTPTSSSATKW